MFWSLSKAIAYAYGLLLKHPLELYAVIVIDALKVKDDV
jgi:hypothetical protein